MRKSLLSTTTNTRELGGYPAASGGITAENWIWRSDAPILWDDEDVRLLRRCGITTIIDLRTDRETERRPCAYADAEGFRYLRFPITEGSEPPAALAEVPESYLRIAQQPETARALRAAAEAESGVMVCCTAGKDRTGVVSALILLACGVDERTIVTDYAVSREYNRERLARYLAEHPEVDRRVVLASETSMEGFLAMIAEKYGGAEGYFRAMGIPETGARIRAKLC